MIVVHQHIPDFVDTAEDKRRAVVSTLQDALALPWIHDAANGGGCGGIEPFELHPGFIRAIYDDGNRFVLATYHDDDGRCG